MPGFDKEIAKLAQRILINPRKIDYHTGVLATKVTPGAAPGAITLLPMSRVSTRCKRCACLSKCWTFCSRIHATCGGCASPGGQRVGAVQTVGCW